MFEDKDQEASKKLNSQGVAKVQITLQKELQKGAESCIKSA